MGPFKSGNLGLQEPPSQSANISSAVHNQKLWVVLFLVLEPWAESSGVGLGPPVPQKGPLKLRVPGNFYLPHVGVGPAHSASPPLLPVSVWLLLYSPSC